MQTDGAYGVREVPETRLNETYFINEMYDNGACIIRFTIWVFTIIFSFKMILL